MKLTYALLAALISVTAFAVDLRVEVFPSPTPGVVSYRLFHGVNTNVLALQATLQASQPLIYTLTNAPLGTNLFGAVAVHGSTQTSAMTTSNFVVITVAPPGGMVIQLTNVPAVISGTITIQP